MPREAVARPHHDWKRFWILAAAAVIPMAVYWPTTGYGFLLDDFVLFRTSPSLADPTSIAKGFLTDVGALRKGADTVISSYYRPVFLALSTLYYQLVGGEPFAWHVAATVLAGLIGTLVCWLFLRLDFAPLIALLGSLVFSLHPAHVSSVAWAAGLQEILAASFVIGALHAALTYRQAGRGALALSVAALSYALALLSKEVAIGLVPFVGLWALWDARNDASHARPLARVTAMLAGVSVLYLLARLAVLGSLAVPPENAPSFRASLFSVPVAFAAYLRLLVWPADFAIFRPERPVHGLVVLPILVSLAALAVLGGLALWAIRTRRDLVLPLGWLVVWLLPVLNLWALDPQWMVTDRYLFLPSLALPWALAFVRPQRAAIAALSILTIVFAGLTVRYAAIFRDERTFIAAMEQAEPTSPLVFAEKGRLLVQDGDLAGARAALTRAVELDPIGPVALLALGDLELRQGELDAAERHYREALVVQPYASRGFKLVTIAWSRAGQRDRARALSDESARRWPDDFEVQLLRALLLGAAGEREPAEAAFAAARRIRPRDPAVAGRLDQAMARLLPTLVPR